MTTTTPTTARHEQVLDDYVELRDQGLTVREGADRLGVTKAALEQVITRARRRGDKRLAKPGVSPPIGVGDSLDAGNARGNSPAERAAAERLVRQRALDGQDRADLLGMLLGIESETP